jgi:hypothetical protein
VLDGHDRDVSAEAALAQQERALTRLVVLIAEDLNVSVTLAAGSAVVTSVRVGQAHRSAFRRLAGAAPPWRARWCVCGPALLSHPGELGPRGVEITLSALCAAAKLSA